MLNGGYPMSSVSLRLMGQQSVGGLWCDYCGRPVPAERTTHRTRNTIAGHRRAGNRRGESVPLQGGRSHISICGGRVRAATEDDHYRGQLATGLVERVAQEPSPRPSDDWRELPAHHVPPWREKDRMRLDAHRARERASDTTAGAPLTVADQLAKVAELHEAGALTAEEFAEAADSPGGRARWRFVVRAFAKS
jgi:hypothetical protein